jgi:hypothetical protein
MAIKKYKLSLHPKIHNFFIFFLSEREVRIKKMVVEDARQDAERLRHEITELGLCHLACRHLPTEEIAETMARQLATTQLLVDVLSERRHDWRAVLGVHNAHDGGRERGRVAHENHLVDNVADVLVAECLDTREILDAMTERVRETGVELRKNDRVVACGTRGCLSRQDNLLKDR